MVWFISDEGCFVDGTGQRHGFDVDEDEDEDEVIESNLCPECGHLLRKFHNHDDCSSCGYTNGFEDYE